LWGAGYDYRVKISDLDANQSDGGYSKAATLRREYTRKSWPEGIPMPEWNSAGPRLEKNPGPESPTSWSEGTYGITYFLFFVAFDVCFTKASDIQVVVDEKVTLSGWAFDEGKEQPTRIAHDPQEVSTELTRDGTEGDAYVLSKRKEPIQDCTHTVIVPDCPLYAPQMFRQAMDLKKSFLLVEIAQTVTVKDKSTGQPVGAAKHSVSIGLDKTGKLVGTP
jgi:hypothetical protein